MHYSDQLIKYIKNQIIYGTPEEDIRQALLGVGWKKEDVDGAFQIVADLIDKEDLEKISSKKINFAIILSMILLSLIIITGYMTYLKVTDVNILYKEVVIKKENPAPVNPNLSQQQYVESLYNKMNQKNNSTSSVKKSN
ncbi:MAG: hypothetical protein WCO35_00185 [Candidatus Nomurabacteria bacterium]